MISGKLISIIETNADNLITSLIQELRTNNRTSTYRNFSDAQMAERTKNVYRNLSSWLGDKTEDDIKEMYNALGRERRGENIPLSHVVSALIITRNHLRRFIENEVVSNSTLEIYQEMEFINYITVFFDKAIYHTIVGYENVCPNSPKA